MRASQLFLRPIALLVLTLVALAPAARAADGPGPSDAEIARDVDAILSAKFTPGQPGVAAIVVKNGKVVYRKAYGLANLELQTPMRPEMVFEIGSVTKQFTSAAIMLLVEQGKIGLGDDIRKYLPEFPDKGSTITVENLLTHTSGLKDYTEDQGWAKLMRQDLTATEIIAITKDQPLNFPPGTKWLYCNTGYVILGAIIEKVTGASYGDFVQKNIFEPLGMKNTRYATNFGLVANRAYGYSKDGDAIVNAQFLSMSQPHAAGALESTVDDLAIWDAAVASGKLLSKASWDRIFTSYKLPNGDDTHYGYGWLIGQFEGHRVIRHNGGIFGYVSEVFRLPDDHVYVAMLTNTDASGIDTGYVVTKIAAAAAGLPYREPTAVTVDPKVLDQYAGVYKIDETNERVVRRDGDHLTTQRTGGELKAAYPSGKDTFFYKESFTRASFTRDASGKVVAMVMDDSGLKQTAARTNKPLPADRAAVIVDPQVLKTYVGVYELAPGFSLTVTSDGPRLFAQATGQPQFELFASAETEFFLKVVDAQITFVKGPDGTLDHLVLHQAGRDMPAKKVK